MGIGDWGLGIGDWGLGQGFLLATDDKTYPYMNEYGGAGGSLGFWNNISDVGSIFSVCEVGVPNVSNIKLPTGGSLKIFRAPDDKANGRAILVFPGGGYGFIAGPNEGSDWAPMFNNLGYTVVQSVPDRPLVTLKCSQVTAPTLTYGRTLFLM